MAVGEERVSAHRIDLAGLPPEDRELSPYTGWVRKHWEGAADALLEGVRRYATPNHARMSCTTRVGSTPVNLKSSPWNR